MRIKKENTLNYSPLANHVYSNHLVGCFVCLFVCVNALYIGKRLLSGFNILLSNHRDQRPHEPSSNQSSPWTHLALSWIIKEPRARNRCKSTESPPRLPEICNDISHTYLKTQWAHSLFGRPGSLCVTIWVTATGTTGTDDLWPTGWVSGIRYVTANKSGRSERLHML